MMGTWVGFLFLIIFSCVCVCVCVAVRKFSQLKKKSEVLDQCNRKTLHKVGGGGSETGGKHLIGHFMYSKKPGEEHIYVHSDFNPFYLGMGVGSGKSPQNIICDYH